MVQFNEDVARFLNDAYDGRDATERRVAALAQLSLSGGETVVDLGCGAGHLTVEASRAVGPEGRVLALDPAEAMRDKTAQRCHDRDNVELVDGRADSTGLADHSVDGIVAVQVFSYVDDHQAALMEARRILKPGGRLVISDIHWGGALWVSTDPIVGERVINYWQQQMACPSAPESMQRLARQAGFQQVQVHPVPVVDIDLRPDGLANMLLTLIEQSARQSDDEHLPQIIDWIADQHQRQQNREFFFSVTNYVTLLR